MNITELKKSIFGYSKESVYQYISHLNQEFSQKLLERDGATEHLVKELRERNAELEKEIENLKAENDIYQQKQSSISESIISAKNYEMEIKNAAVLEDKRIREEIDKEKQKQEMRLKKYIETIDTYKASLVNILKQFEIGLEGVAEEGRSILSENSVLSEDEAFMTLLENNNDTDLQNIHMFQRNHMNTKMEETEVEKCVQ